jgi:hypothetical protein
MKNVSRILSAVIAVADLATASINRMEAGI